MTVNDKFCYLKFMFKIYLLYLKSNNCFIYKVDFFSWERGSHEYPGSLCKCVLFVCLGNIYGRGCLLKVLVWFIVCFGTVFFFPFSSPSFSSVCCMFCLHIAKVVLFRARSDVCIFCQRTFAPIFILILSLLATI